MAREILFRGKRLEIGDWVEGSLITYPDGDCYIARPSGDPNVLDKFFVDPATVGQHIGLTDKNGKRIFEGDILRWVGPDGESGKVVVVYFGGAFMLKSVECPRADPDLFADFEIGDQTLDIIGNIHDNPELLGNERREGNHDC